MFHIVQTTFGKRERFDVVRKDNGKAISRGLTKAAANWILKTINNKNEEAKTKDQFATIKGAVKSLEYAAMVLESPAESEFSENARELNSIARQGFIVDQFTEKEGNLEFPVFLFKTEKGFTVKYGMQRSIFDHFDNAVISYQSACNHARACAGEFNGEENED